MNRRLINAASALVALSFVVTTTCAQDGAASQQDLVNEYWAQCHNARTKSRGVVLEKLEAGHPAASPELWEKAIGNLRARLMPPSGAPRPDRPVLEKFPATLRAAID